MRPVLRGMCSYQALLDGTLWLSDIARMNDAISVNDENARRIREASRPPER